MATIAARLEQEYPATNKDRSVTVTRMRDDIVGDVRPTLFLLWGAVSVVLLIACANTATLLLGKAMVRTREIAVRVALGASRRRIVRQLMTESLLLACMAGLAGLLVAVWASKVLIALAPADLPRLAETAIDTQVLVFTLVISLATSMLFGVLPALHASKADLNSALKQAATRSVTGGGVVRLRGVLVVMEMAFAVALLAGAGLLTKSLAALQNVELGFRPENVLVMRATSPAATAEEANRFFSGVLARTSTLPGVIAAGATMVPPGHAGPSSSGGVIIDHLPEKPDWKSGTASVLSVVAPGTFRALGIPVKNGRDFSDTDTADKPFVAIVNQALVRRAFRGENPIGRTVFCPFDSVKGMTIVGVVGDVRQRGPEHDPVPECYMTYRQHQYNESALSIVVRTAGDPNALTQSLRRVAGETSPDVPVTFTTMETIVSENEAAPRFRTLLFGIFAGLAVCLSMAGVYGVTSYAAGQRSPEIGLRMALGASGGSVLRLILGQALRLAGVGLVLGLSIAVAGTRLLRTMLFEVHPNDPAVYLAVTGLLGAVALVACYIPARRATRVDPAIALRCE
jgi:predicted permease